jgi:hypothetical protein
MPTDMKVKGSGLISVRWQNIKYARTVELRFFREASSREAVVTRTKDWSRSCRKRGSSRGREATRERDGPDGMPGRRSRAEGGQSHGSPEAGVGQNLVALGGCIKESWEIIAEPVEVPWNPVPEEEEVVGDSRLVNLS